MVIVFVGLFVLVFVCGKAMVTIFTINVVILAWLCEYTKNIELCMLDIHYKAGNYMSIKLLF
jgi:hypothetical protein